MEVIQALWGAPLTSNVPTCRQPWLVLPVIVGCAPPTPDTRHFPPLVPKLFLLCQGSPSCPLPETEEQASKSEALAVIPSPAVWSQASPTPASVSPSVDRRRQVLQAAGVSAFPSQDSAHPGAQLPGGKSPFAPRAPAAICRHRSGCQAWADLQPPRDPVCASAGPRCLRYLLLQAPRTSGGGGGRGHPACGCACVCSGC